MHLDAQWFTTIGPSGVLDIALMTLLIYSVLVWLKNSRVAFVLTGIFIIAVVYLLAHQFNLTMTAEVFDKFFAVFLIALVVIFQEELKHFFEQVAVWSLNRRLLGPRPSRPSREETAVLSRVAVDLARERIGALIVCRGRDTILRHLEGGIPLNGEISEPLLKSIFDRHSPGHDGAVVLEGNTVTQFATHLPLSKNLAGIGQGGTRHAAALGLAERSDALCLAVSEERGSISLARNGELRVIEDPEDLHRALDQFYRDTSPKPALRPWQEFFRKNTREKLWALALALSLWFVLVDGSKQIYRSYTIPITYLQPPPPFRIASVEPYEVQVTFHGPKRSFYFLSRDRLRLLLKPALKTGEQRVRVYTADFVHPKELALENVEPREVRFRLEQ